MLRYVTINKLSELSGYSEGAIRKKIERGEWLEGALFIRAPDNRILIDTEAYQSWARNDLIQHVALRKSLKLHSN